jgi:hypothetical protein
MGSNEQSVDFIFQHLVDTGAVVLKGLNPAGEPVYSVTEKCKEVFPEFYKAYREELSATAYELWSMGLIDIVFDGDEERVVFNETHYQKLSELADELSLEQADFLISLGAPVTYRPKGD